MLDLLVASLQDLWLDTVNVRVAAKALMFVYVIDRGNGRVVERGGANGGVADRATGTTC